MALTEMLNLQVKRLGPLLTFAEVGSIITSARKLRLSQDVLIALLSDVQRVLPDLAGGDAVNILWAYVNDASLLAHPSVQEMVPLLLRHIGNLFDELDPGSLSRGVWCCAKVPLPSTPSALDTLHRLSMRAMDLSHTLPSDTIGSILHALSKLYPHYKHMALQKELCKVLPASLEVDEISAIAAAKVLSSLHRLETVGGLTTPAMGDANISRAIRSLSRSLVGAPKGFHDRACVMALTAWGAFGEHFEITACEALAVYLRDRIALLDTKGVVMALHAISKLSSRQRGVDNPLLGTDIVDGLIARTWVACATMEPLSVAILCKACSGLTNYFVQPLVGQLHRVLLRTMDRFSPREAAMTLHALAALHAVVPCEADLLQKAADHGMTFRVPSCRVCDLAVFLSAYTHLIGDGPSVLNSVALLNKAGDLICSFDCALSAKEVTTLLAAFGRASVRHVRAIEVLTAQIGPRRGFSACELCTCVHALGKVQHTPHHGMDNIDEAINSFPSSDFTPASAQAALFGYARMYRQPPASLCTFNTSKESSHVLNVFQVPTPLISEMADLDDLTFPEDTFATGAQSKPLTPEKNSSSNSVRTSRSIHEDFLSTLV